MGIKGALTPPTRSFKYLKLNMCSIPYKFLQCFPPMAMQWHLSHPVMDVLLWTGAHHVLAQLCRSHMWLPCMAKLVANVAVRHLTLLFTF